MTGRNLQNALVWRLLAFGGVWQPFTDHLLEHRDETSKVWVQAHDRKDAGHEKQCDHRQYVECKVDNIVVMLHQTNDTCKWISRLLLSSMNSTHG